MRTIASRSRRVADDAGAASFKRGSGRGAGGRGGGLAAAYLVDQPAVGAQRSVGGHAAPLAVTGIVALDARERWLSHAEELLHEGELRSRAREFEAVQHVL